MFLWLITEPACLLLCSCVEQGGPTAGAAGGGSLPRAHSAVTTLQGPLEVSCQGRKREGLFASAEAVGSELCHSSGLFERFEA